MKRCWLFFHDWMPWKIIRQGETISIINDGVIGFWQLQVRTCKKCGYRQIKEDET